MGNELDFLLKKHGIQKPAPAPQPGQPEQMGYVEDSARSGLSGLYDGAASTIGSFGDLGAAGREALSGWFQTLGMDPETADQSARIWVNRVPMMAVPSSKGMADMKPDMIEHEPQTEAGEISERVGQLAPSMLMPSGTGWVTKGLSLLGSAAGGHYGRKAGEAASDFFGLEKSRPYVEGGADLLGTFVGGYGPEIIKKIVTPNPMDKERQALAKVLDDAGVETSAGQRTGNDVLHYKESQTGGTAYSNIRNRQKDQFTSAALDKAGIKGSSAGTPKAFNDQHKLLGAEFDRLQNYGMKPDSQLYTDLLDVRDKYNAVTPDSMRVSIIRDTIDDLATKAQNNLSVDGAWLKTMGTNLRKARDSAIRSGDANLSDALSDLIDVIDDGVERTIATANPADLGAFKEVRKQYRNLLTLEEAASRNAAGQITPDSLVEATKKFETRKGYSRGKGPFNELARAGKLLMTEQPQSGTANRMSAAVPALKSIGNLPTLLGALAGAAMSGGNPVGAAIGGGTGAALQGGVNYLRMTPGMQKYLINQLLTDWNTANSAVRGGTAAALRLNEMEKN
jgi:hypothetical protein